MVHLPQRLVPQRQACVQPHALMAFWSPNYRSVRLLLISSGVLLTSFASRGTAEEPPVEVPPLRIELPTTRSATVNLAEAPESAKTLLTELVLHHFPHDYLDDRKWGHTRERWDGLKVSLDGLKVKTKRRRKSVNHGTWKKYHLELIDPDQHLTIKIVDLHGAGPGTFGFGLLVDAKLHATARLQEWNNGVRLFSTSLDADAHVELQLEMEITTKLDASRFPPDVTIIPVAKTADLKVRQLKVNRISHADGPLVRELGDALEKVVRRQIAEKNDKLVAKINRQLEKKKDKMRFSMQDWVKHQWLGIDAHHDEGPKPGSGARVDSGSAR